MRNTKKLIITLMMILIILIIIIVSIVMKLQNINSDVIQQNEENNIVGSTDVVENKVLEKVTIRNDYYTVKNIVDQYYSVLCELNKTTEDILIFEDDGSNTNLEEIVSQEKEIAKKRIYDFFDASYAQETGLTIDNVQEKLGNYNDLYVLIEEMYVRDITISSKLYFVSGIIVEKETTNEESFKLIIAVDSNNSTFNIYTSEYSEKHNFEDKDKQININEIEKRIYNKYTKKSINEEEYAKELLKTYTQSIMYNNTNYSYSRLNEEYKNKRFKDKTEYEKYIKDNRKSIISATLKYYKTNIYEGYKQYICIDQKENYYIFNEKAIMDYDLILDIYTLDLPEFTEKYENATDEEKAVLNAQKITEALKGKDYNYLYNKLDTTFRNNKFSTVDDLQTYVESNFLEDNSIQFKELITEGDIYIYRAYVKEKSKDEEGKILNVIVKLEKETEFVYSFSFE